MSESTLKERRSAERMVKQMLRHAGNVTRVLRTLTPREDRILRDRYGFESRHGRTIKEIAESFGLTTSRIYQIEKKAIRKLAHPLRAKVVWKDWPK